MRTIIIAALLLANIFVVAAIQGKERKMAEIRLSLGNNIVETGKNSGIPEFDVGNVDGFIQYKVTQVPTGIPIVYDRPGYVLKIAPAFSFTLYADRHRTPNDLVVGARVSIDTSNITSHTEAQAYIDRLILQFSAGGWKRHLAAHCPATTGRSSLLNLDGELGSYGCPLDPAFKIAPIDWKDLFGDGGSYEWLGDGILATLTVAYREYGGEISYQIAITFDDYLTKLDVTRENELRKQKDGDAKGWNSSLKAVEERKDASDRGKKLEQNAIKRGDALVPR